LLSGAGSRLSPGEAPSGDKIKTGKTITCRVGVACGSELAMLGIGAPALHPQKLIAANRAREMIARLKRIWVFIALEQLGKNYSPAFAGQPQMAAESNRSGSGESAALNHRGR
jgi:hypothetical protein